jgi:hypothetical protein
MICDSTWDGHRITTLELQMPKFILAEFNTHRMFSRNASSTRAIPTAKLIEQVRTDPVIPVAWAKNKKGMQAGVELDASLFEPTWRAAANSAADYAEKLTAAGLHKQWAGRVLEPFMWTRVVVTSTEWTNFFQQRRHPDAQPEIKALADAMWEQLEISKPAERWEHLPYFTWEDPFAHRFDISGARCARVSYRTHDGRWPEVDEDLRLANDLVSDGHPSPFEHPARAAEGRHANFTGWRSIRHDIF